MLLLRLNAENEKGCSIEQAFAFGSEACLSIGTAVCLAWNWVPVFLHEISLLAATIARNEFILVTGLQQLFAGGSIRNMPIMNIRNILPQNGFTQTITRNGSGYLFRNAAREEVRVMSRGGWDVGIKNASGNYLDEFGNVGFLNSWNQCHFAMKTSEKRDIERLFHNH
jgi:hypothetical protein